MIKIKTMQPADKRRVMDFMRVVHPEDVKIIEKVIFGNPFHLPEHFAYIEDEGQIVSFTGLIHHRQRFWGQTVKVGEIAVVGTHPDYRRRGLASALMDHWLRYMRKGGMPLCFLFGIPNFYQQFGFEYAVPHHAYDYVTIAPGQLEGLKEQCEVRPLEDRDIPQLNRVYEHCNRDNPGTEVRAEDYWRFRIETTTFGPHHWLTVKKGAQVRGYLWVTVGEDRITVREAGAVDEMACETIGAFLYRTARKGRITDPIGMRGPLNNPVAGYLHRKGARFACRNEIFPGSWAGMYRIVDLPSILGELAPILTNRLAGTRYYQHTGRYLIESEVGRALLCIEEGNVRVEHSPAGASERRIHLPASILTQLILGYRDVAYYRHKLQLSETDFQLLQSLFPLGYPCIWDLEMSEELQ